jgi:glycosyltransferase involved in cell wall biosynthesis
MKTFAILIEPASYTVDRNKRVYEPRNIDYCYLKNSSKASNISSDAVCLEGYSFNKKIQYLKGILKDYDAVIMNGYINSEFVILFLLNFFYKKPIGIDSDTQFSLPKNLLKARLKKNYLNYIFRNKHIYGLAGGTKNHFALFQNFGMPISHIFLMPMMVDNDKFKNENYTCKPFNTFNFLFVGRLIEHKNIKMLIKAFETISSKYSFAQLLIAGEGPLSEELKRENNHNKNIKFLGAKFDNDLIEVYKNGHVLVLPSSYEPWGLVVNEALSAGLPVIVSDKVGAAFDLVELPDTGFVFNSEKPQELVDAMESMISKNNLYKDFANKGYLLMKNNWNFSLYNKCLNDLFLAMSVNKRI